MLHRQGSQILDVEVCTMDASLLASWIQLIVWAVGVLVWGWKHVTGEVPMPAWIRAHLSFDKAMGAVVILGLLGSATSLYLNYQRDHPTILEDVTISAYLEGGNAPLAVIRDQTFENVDIPLDGHIYDHCTFINACLMYSGGAYQLQHATFKNHWRVCAAEPSLKNLLALQFALQQMRPITKFMKKTVVVK